MPGKVAASGGVFVIGLPATLAYLSEGDGLPVGRLLVDAIVWLAACRVFQPGACSASRRLPVVRVREHEDGDRPIDDVQPQAYGLLAELLEDGRWDL